MPATVPADVDKALLAGGPAPAGLSADEQRAYEQLVRTFKQVDYARLMGSRPQTRSEEHTSELQSRQYLVCRLLLEKKKQLTPTAFHSYSSIRTPSLRFPPCHALHTPAYLSYKQRIALFSAQFLRNLPACALSVDFV